MDKYRDGWRSELDRQRTDYTNHLKTLKAKHEESRQKESHRRKEVSRLQSLLLQNEKRNDAWSDDGLKLKFRHLQQQVNDSIFSQLPALSASSIMASDPEIDTTNFLGRRGDGDGNCRAVVMSAVWTILINEFFSAPFGFGALGVDDGKESLMAVYREWRALLNGDQGPLDG
jgi:hypothetical protein